MSYRTIYLIAALALFNQCAIADSSNDVVPFDVAFDEKEMVKVYSELEIEPGDPKYLKILGRYTDRGGRRTGDVIEIYPIAVHELGKMCVVQPEFLAGWEPNVGFGRFRRNIYFQRHIWWATSPDDCSSITFEDMFGGNGPDLIVDVEIDLATTLLVHETEELIFSTVLEFAEISDSEQSEELEILTLFDAEDYDAAADICATIFRDKTKASYQVCLASGDDGLEISTVDYFVHKYEKLKK